MFRPLLIAAIVAGMVACEYRCLLGGAGPAAPQAGADGRACGHAGHRGCEAADGTPGPRRTAPCCPGHDEGPGGGCGCQGVCGGAVSSPTCDLASLLAASGPASPTPPAVAEREPPAAREASGPGEPGPGEPGPPSGRARRIRYASLLT